MARTFSIVLYLVFLLALSACSELSSPPQPTSAITVHVAFGDTPIAGKSVTLLETGENKQTGADGTATFVVPAGEYTVRVYNINAGGPALQHMDFSVSLKSSEHRRVEVFDCLSCY